MARKESQYDFRDYLARCFDCIGGDSSYNLDLSNVGG